MSHSTTPPPTPTPTTTTTTAVCWRQVHTPEYLHNAAALVRAWKRECQRDGSEIGNLPAREVESFDGCVCVGLCAEALGPFDTAKLQCHSRDVNTIC